MKAKSTIPQWVQPVTLEDWPVQLIESPELHYRLSLRRGWEISPLENKTDMETEHIFQGRYRGELLTVSAMTRANPQDSIRNWVEAMMKFIGIPLLALKAYQPQMVEWEYCGIFPELAERLQVNEVHLYTGLAGFSQESDLIRLYILLARRENWAWKIGLSFLSACLPGMPQEMVAANDSVRGGATFGALELW